MMWLLTVYVLLFLLPKISDVFLDPKRLFWGEGKKLISPSACIPCFCRCKSWVISPCKHLSVPSTWWRHSSPSSSAAAFCCQSEQTWCCLVFGRPLAIRWAEPGLLLPLAAAAESHEMGCPVLRWRAATGGQGQRRSFEDLGLCLVSSLVLVAGQRSWSLLQDHCWKVTERKNGFYLWWSVSCWASPPHCFSGGAFGERNVSSEAARKHATSAQSHGLFWKKASKENMPLTVK